MALIKFGSLVGAASGSIGGMVIKNTHNGPVVARAATTPATNSPDQVHQQSHLLRAANGWRAMTNQQRNAWRAYARSHPVTNRLGITTHRTGFQWFMVINAHKLRTGNALITATPYDLPRSPPLQPSCSFSIGGPQTITFGPPSASYQTVVTVFVSRPFTTVAPAHYGFWRYFGWFNCAGGEVTVTDEFAAAFPCPQTLERFALKFYAADFAFVPTGTYLITGYLSP